MAITKPQSEVCQTQTDGAPQRDAVRGVRACLTLMGYYALVVGAIAVVGLSAPLFGIHLAAFRLDALFVIGLTHLSTGGVLLGMRRFVCRSHTMPRWLVPMTLSAMPLLAIASCDRLSLMLTPPIPTTGGAVLFQDHPTRLWTLRPNASSASMFVDLNERGMRGSLIPFRKAPGERRVVVLGDSVAFGFASPLAERFDSVLMEGLRESGINNVSVVNLSVPGYSPWQELDVLRNEGLDYDPDLVLYAFCLNDVVDWFWREIPRGGAPPFQNPIWERSGLLRLARTAYHRWQVRRVERDHDGARYSMQYVLHEAQTPGVEEMWEKTLSDIRRMVEVARLNDRRMAIMLFPYDGQVRPGDERVHPQRRVVAWARDLDVPCLDLVDAFRASCRHNPPKGCRLFSDGWHLSALGHEVTAEALRAFLEQIGFLTVEDSAD